MELFKAHVTVEARKGKYLTDMGEIKRKTEASTKKMQSSWNRIGKSITDNSAKIRKMGIAVGAAGALITATLTKIVHSATKLGDELDKMSLRTGESVEQLSALSFAAQISGSSIQEMENGIRRLSRNMNDFQNGIGEAARAFEKLDVSVLDSSGNLRSASSFIIEVADKFNELTSSSEQAAVAQEIFGRGGTAMLPLLKQGSAGIKELTDRAAELGLVISTEAAAAAAEFNDRLTEMKESLKVASAQLGFMLMPILQPFVEDLTEIVGQVARWTEANQGATRAILAFSFELGGALTAIGALLIILPSLVAGVAAIGGAAVLGPIAAFVVAFAGLVAIVIAAKEKATALKREVDALTKSAKAFTQEDFAEGVKGAYEAFDVLAEKITEVRSELDRLQPQMAMLGTGGLERIRELEEALARLSAAQARLFIPFVADPNVTNRIKQLNALVASLREMGRATGFLRGDRAERKRLPPVRPQLIPEIPDTEKAKAAAEKLVTDLQNIWYNFFGRRRQAAKEAAEAELKEELDLEYASQAERSQMGVEGAEREADEKLQVWKGYYDLLAKIAKDNEERIAGFRRDISKSVINDILDADRERREKDLEESVAHAKQVAEIWDNVAQGISDTFESMFSDLLQGQIESWSDFGNRIKDIMIRVGTEIAASKVYDLVRRLFPGGDTQIKGTTELVSASAALQASSTNIAMAAAQLNAAAAKIAGGNIAGPSLVDGEVISAAAAGDGGSMGGVSGILVLAEFSRQMGNLIASISGTETPGQRVRTGLLAAPWGLPAFIASQVEGFAEGGIFTKPTLGLIAEKGPEAVVSLSGGKGQQMGGGSVNHFHTTIQITEFDMDTMSQAKVNAWMGTKGYNALKNMASKGKINKSMVG